MNNQQLIDPQVPVTDEELDQMIWRLERDGMTPKMLSLMRELQEVRRNSPATPDSWIPVSVRMPPEGTPLLVCSGNGVVQRTVYGFDGENWIDWYEQYDPVKAEPDDLWQPLPAAPKEVG